MAAAARRVTRPIDPLDPWQCQTCGEVHPIKPLARDCEARHRADSAPTQPDEQEDD